MAKLLSVSDLRHALQWDDVPTLNAVLETTLEATSLLLQTRLHTKFEKETNREDKFYPRWSPQFGGSFTTYLRLANSFLTADAVTVVASGSAVGLTEDPTSVTEFEVDRDRGLITLRTTDYTDLFLKVTYTYGFVKNATTKVYASVPEGLQAVAHLQAVVNLASSAPKVVADAFDSNSLGTLKQLLEDSLRQYSRYMPWAEKPI